MKLPKLISEPEIIFMLKGKMNEEDLYNFFIEPNFKKIQKRIVKDILRAKLYKKHFFRIEVSLHAQEVDKDDVK